MTLRRIDYDELERQVLIYLYHNRREKDADMRTSRSLVSKFKLNRVSVHKALYELKGMGVISNHYVGNSIVWAITEEGIKKVKEENKNVSE